MILRDCVYKCVTLIYDDGNFIFLYFILLI